MQRLIQRNPYLYGAAPSLLPGFLKIIMAVWVAAMLLMLISRCTFLYLATVSQRKRRQVLDAIDPTQPGSASAQRPLWVGLAVPIGLITGLLAGYLFSGTLGT
jgi:hypothetical protein